MFFFTNFALCWVVIETLLMFCVQVITVLMKSTSKEQAQCQAASALLATVCLFCGDEVSRQQFRR